MSTFQGRYFFRQLHRFLTPLGGMYLVLGAHAALTPTATGNSYGLQITDFVSSFSLSPTFGIGPNGIASASDGNILVADYSGKIYRFSDVDGQLASNTLNVNHEFTESGSTAVLANLNGTVYLARERQLFSLHNDGSVNQTLLSGALVTSGGLAANPVNGHLYSNSNIDPGQNLTDINVSNNSYTLHPADGGWVGAVSLDGSTLYNAHSPNVEALDTTVFGAVWTSSTYSRAMATIQTGSLVGDILGYDHLLGNLYVFDRNTGAATLIDRPGRLRGRMSGSTSNCTW